MLRLVYHLENYKNAFVLPQYIQSKFDGQIPWQCWLDNRVDSATYAIEHIHGKAKEYQAKLYHELLLILYGIIWRILSV